MTCHLIRFWNRKLDWKTQGLAVCYIISWAKMIATCMFSLCSSTKLYCKLLHNKDQAGCVYSVGVNPPRLQCDLPRWNIPLPLSGSSFPCHPSPSCPSCSSSSCNSISWWCRSSMLEWVKQRPRQWQWWPRTALRRGDGTATHRERERKTLTFDRPIIKPAPCHVPSQIYSVRGARLSISSGKN